MSSLARLHRAILGILSPVGFVGPLVARLSVGIMFAQSGWGKLNDIPAVVDFFTKLGIPYPELQAPFVAGVEFGCGWLILLGLASRLAAIPLIITMIVAMSTALREQITGIADVFALSEFTYAAVLLWVLVAGPGAVSIDAIITRYVLGTDDEANAGRQGVSSNGRAGVPVR